MTCLTSPFTRFSKARWNPCMDEHRATIIRVALPATQIVVEDEIDVDTVDNEALCLTVGLGKVCPAGIRLNVPVIPCMGFL